MSTWNVLPNLGTRVGFVAVLATVAGCGSDPAGPAPVGPPAMLAFVPQPTGVAAGAPLSVTIQVQDAAGNRTTGTNEVTVALAGGGTLGGTLMVTAVNGEATFTDLTISQTATGVTLNASATGLAGATSGPFNVVQPVITVSPGGIDSLIGAGSTIQYDAVATDPTNGMTFTATIAWASDDAAVAMVDPATGILTVVGNGTATISATTPSAAAGTTTFRSATMSAAQNATFGYATNQTLVGIEWDGTNYYLYNGGTTTGEIQILDAAGAVQTTTAVTLDARSLMYRQADGLFYAKAFNNADLLQIDPTTGVIASVRTGIFLDAQSKPAMAPDGSLIYEHTQGTIHVLDFATGAEVSTITGVEYNGDLWGGLGIRTDGQFFYTGDPAGVVYVHDSQGRLVTTVTLPVTPGSLNGLILSYANGMLWTSDAGGSTGNLFGYVLSKQ